MALYGIIAFVIYGWVEFEAMAHVVDAIGGLLAFLGIFVTAVIGIHLLRTQSALVMAQFRADMAKGQLNSGAIAASLSLLAGAILMLIPGYVTDTLGLLCFIPGLRTIIGAFLARHFGSAMMARGAPMQGRGFSGFHGASEHDTPEHNTSWAHSDDHIKQTRTRSTQFAPNDDGNDDIIEGEFKEKN